MLSVEEAQENVRKIENELQILNNQLNSIPVGEHDSISSEKQDEYDTIQLNIRILNQKLIQEKKKAEAKVETTAPVETTSPQNKPVTEDKPAEDPEKGISPQNKPTEDPEKGISPQNKPTEDKPVAVATPPSATITPCPEIDDIDKKRIEIMKNIPEGATLMYVNGKDKNYTVKIIDTTILDNNATNKKSNSFFRRGGRKTIRQRRARKTIRRRAPRRTHRRKK